MTDMDDQYRNGEALDPADETSRSHHRAAEGAASHALVRRATTEVGASTPHVAEVQDAPTFEEQVAAAPPLPVIGRRRRRRKRVDGNATAREGRRRMLWVTSYVYAVATALHAAGAMTEPMLRGLSAMLKRGARRRRLTPHEYDALEREYRAKAANLASALPDPTLALARAEALASERCEEEVKRRAAQSARRASRAHTRQTRAQMRAEGKISLAALTDDQADTLRKRQQVLHAMARGLNWAEACTEAGVVASRATVYRWRDAFKKSGIEGLVDGRVLNGKPGIPLEIRTLAHAAWRQCAKGNSGAIYAVFKGKCEAAGYAVPSHGWLADYIKYEIPADEKLVRDEGLQEWRRQAAPRHTVERAAFANDLWQCDDTPLDFWVRTPHPDGSWEPAKPYVTAIIDVHSRACMAVSVYTRQPNAWSVALTLRKAILPKSSRFAPFRGLPARFAMDNGKNYRSDDLARTLAMTGIRAEYCAPRSPNQKPEIERFLRTLQENLLPRMSGYSRAYMVSEEAAAKQVMSLRTIEELRIEIDQWVDEYNDSHHEGISKTLDTTPRERWEHTAILRDIEPDKLNRLLLQSTPRTVQSKGVRLTLRTGDSAEFWSPALTDKYEARVLLLYNPEDLASVIVADEGTGLPICEAYRMGIEGARYTAGDIVDARRGREAQLAGVAERLHEYHLEAERSDRLSPARTREVRRYLDAMTDADESSLAAPVQRLALPAGVASDLPQQGHAPHAAVDSPAGDGVKLPQKKERTTRSRAQKPGPTAAESAARAEEIDLMHELMRLQTGR